MAELIHEHSVHLVSSAGISYRARVYGEERADGTWSGWIEFMPIGGGPSWKTEQETSQPNKAALEYWAGGLEAVYLDGAFERATHAVGI